MATRVTRRNVLSVFSFSGFFNFFVFFVQPFFGLHFYSDLLQSQKLIIILGVWVLFFWSAAAHFTTECGIGEPPNTNVYSPRSHHVISRINKCHNFEYSMNLKTLRNVFASCLELATQIILYSSLNSWAR